MLTVLNEQNLYSLDDASVKWQLQGAKLVEDDPHGPNVSRPRIPSGEFLASKHCPMQNLIMIWRLLIASQLSRNSHKWSISVYQSINLVSLQFTPQKTKEAGWLAKANSFLICRLSAKSRLLLTHLWTEVVRSADCGPCDRLASRTLRTSTNSSLVAEGPKGNILCAAAMARTGQNMEKPAPPTFLPEISWHHVGNIKKWNEKGSMLELCLAPAHYQKQCR